MSTNTPRPASTWPFMTFLISQNTFQVWRGNVARPSIELRSQPDNCLSDLWFLIIRAYLSNPQEDRQVLLHCSSWILLFYLFVWLLQQDLTQLQWLGLLCTDLEIACTAKKLLSAPCRDHRLCSKSPKLSRCQCTKSGHEGFIPLWT